MRAFMCGPYQGAERLSSLNERHRAREQYYTERPRSTPEQTTLSSRSVKTRLLNTRASTKSVGQRAERFNPQR